MQKPANEKRVSRALERERADYLRSCEVNDVTELTFWQTRVLQSFFMYGRVPSRHNFSFLCSTEYSLFLLRFLLYRRKILFAQHSNVTECGPIFAGLWIPTRDRFVKLDWSAEELLRNMSSIWLFIRLTPMLWDNKTSQYNRTCLK